MAKKYFICGIVVLYFEGGGVDRYEFSGNYFGPVTDSSDPADYKDDAFLSAVEDKMVHAEHFPHTSLAQGTSTLIKSIELLGERNTNVDFALKFVRAH